MHRLLLSASRLPCLSCLGLPVREVRCCLERLYPLLGHTLLLSTLSLLANIPITRPCGWSCVFLRAVSVGYSSRDSCPSATPRATPSFFLNVVPTCFDVAVAKPRLLPPPLCALRCSPRECPAHFAVSPAVGVSRARHRLSVAFRDAWLVLLSRRNVLLVLDVVLRSVDGEFDIELGRVRVPLEMSSQQLRVCELSP